MKQTLLPSLIRRGSPSLIKKFISVSTVCKHLLATDFCFIDEEAAWISIILEILAYSFIFVLFFVFQKADVFALQMLSNIDSN